MAMRRGFACVLLTVLASSTRGQDANERASAVIQVGTPSPTFGLLAPEGFGGFDFNRDFLRGFANESALRDGHRDYGYLGTTSFTNVESIEVFKGPASALFGNGKASLPRHLNGSYEFVTYRLGATARSGHSTGTRRAQSKKLPSVAALTVQPNR